MFPSLSDTFGNVVMEAMASGLAVLSFDCAAAAEHVVDGVSGRLMSPGDDAAFMAAAVDLALTPLQLTGYGVAAIAAARRASWDDVLTRFEARLVDTVDALETPPARLSVVA